MQTLSNLYKNTHFKMDGNVQYVISHKQIPLSTVCFINFNPTKYKLHRQFYSSVIFLYFHTPLSIK